LFASLPGAARRGQQLEIIRGSVPPLDRVFSGCRFAGRCDHAWERCNNEIPAWSEVARGTAYAAICLRRFKLLHRRQISL